MNNSFIAQQNLTLEENDRTPRLRERESELVKIIGAIEKIDQSAEWQILKEKVFDGVVESLLKQRETEVEKKPLNGPMIHSLNGQLAWAKKYSNLLRLADIYKLELRKIKEQLNVKND